MPKKTLSTAFETVPVPAYILVPVDALFTSNLKERVYLALVFWCAQPAGDYVFVRCGEQDY